MKAFVKPAVTRALGPGAGADDLVWRPPNVDGIRRFAAERMGWNPDETDRHLGPVLAQLARDDRGAGQTRLDAFYLAYHDNARFAAVRSERLEEALAGRTGRAPRPRPLAPTIAASAAEPRLGEDDTGVGGGDKLGDSAEAKTAPRRTQKGKAPKAAAAKVKAPKKQSSTAAAGKGGEGSLHQQESRRNPARRTRPSTFAPDEAESGSDSGGFEPDVFEDDDGDVDK
jgi:hypothetical protein